ncbi:MAG: hypothetical protein ABSC19_09745 [Syntrophorhabdales bacterium]|jgi:hypothetical protein
MADKTEDGSLAGMSGQKGEKKEGEATYKIRLKVVDRETAQSRYVTLDEAKDWDWDTPDIWRMIGGWQITSFQQLLNLLYMKMEKGITEVEMLEAPRFTMLAGG